MIRFYLRAIELSNSSYAFIAYCHPLEDSSGCVGRDIGAREREQQAIALVSPGIRFCESFFFIVSPSPFP